MDETGMKAVASSGTSSRRRADGTYVGIVMDGGMFSVAVIDFARQRVETRTFPADVLDCESIAATARAVDDGRAPSLAQMARFLDREVIDKESSQFLLEVPRMQLEVGSPHLALLLFLAKHGYAEFPVIEPMLHARVLDLCTLNPGMVLGGAARPALFLGQGIAAAYGSFLLGACDFAEVAAVCAGLIAEHEILYHYFTTYGLVPSSADVVNWVEWHQGRPAGFRDLPPGVKITFNSSNTVICPDESFRVRFARNTRFDAIHEVHARYADATERHLHLGEVTAYKLALLEVCREWRMQLHCSPSGYRPRRPRPVFRPEDALPVWIAEFLGS